MERNGMLGGLGLCSAVAAMVGWAGGVGGCAKSEDTGWFSSKPSGMVRAGEFVGEASESTRVAPSVGAVKPPVIPVGEASIVGAPVGARVMSIGGAGTGAAAGAARQSDLRTSVGAPPVGANSGAQGAAMVIDAVVGQINGRPVFATEILEPLDGALRAAGKDAPDLASWQKAAASSIVPELKRRIADELILSEARRSLTPEQKQGLLHFLGQIESALISEHQGSEVKADEQFREQNGRSLKQEAEDIKDRELIRHEIATKVDPRVAVPWRDVQNEYERQHDKWHPPAEYTFRMIYAPTDNAASVEKIRGLLASGASFEKVAEDGANDFNRREKGKLVRKTGLVQSEGEFSPWPDVNVALRGLGVGQMAGPIVFAPDKARPGATRTAWVYLEKVDQPVGTSLYDAQLDVAADLRVERETDERQRYFERLWKRGNVSKLEVMVEKLLGIATERYAGRFVAR